MPPPFPTNQLDYVNPRVWAGFVRDIPLPADHITEQYLPMRDVAADRILVEIGQYAQPMAPFVDYDQEAPQIDRGPRITNAWFDAMNVKFKERFRGSDFRWLRDYGARPVGEPAGLMAATQGQRVRDAVTDLNSSVDTRIEWLRINALLGRITQAPNVDSDVDIDISFPITTATADPLWSDTENADPILDTQTWTRALKARGVNFSDMIVSLDTMWLLAQNKRLREGAATLIQTPAYLSNAQINAQFAQFGITVKPYNSVYTLRTYDGAGNPIDTSYPIFPDTTALFLPSDRVGYCGTVPQYLGTPRWSTGKYTWVDTPDNNPSMQDPLRWEYGVGWGGMPIITFPNRIIAAKVA